MKIDVFNHIVTPRYAERRLHVAPPKLRLQEQDLLQAIGTEQGRWADFSARLDELERALTRR